MKTNFNFLFSLFLFLFIDNKDLIGQKIQNPEPGSKLIVHMKDGEELRGELASIDEKTLILKTVNGEMHLNAGNIKYFEPDNYLGKFKYPNPHYTRYFYGPSGIPLEKNKGYYQNILVSTNFIYYAPTDHFTIGGGFEFISSVLGYPIWFLTPKFGLNLSQKSHVGAGIFFLGIANEGALALPYGVYTHGTKESNVSLGIGYGFTNPENAKLGSLMFSGTHRVSNSISLLTENYVFTVDDYFEYFGIHGIRILAQKNAFDLGLIIIPDIADEIPALPFVGYSRAF